jgi:single-strand DNA-binding protein
MDRQGESHIQLSINADSIAFVNAGKKDEQSENPKQAAKKGAKSKKTLAPPQDAPAPNEKDMPF